MKPRLITVDKDKLCERLAMACSHCRVGQDGITAFCSRRIPDGCNVEMLDKILWQCPSDCIHWQQSKWKPCEPTKCTTIKRIIKELTEQ